MGKLFDNCTEFVGSNSMACLAAVGSDVRHLVKIIFLPKQIFF
jgi:hypothetical protein